MTACWPICNAVALQLMDGTSDGATCRQAALYGDRRLIEIGGHTWSFAETVDMAARFGGALRAAGIERGDHVAVMCSNRPEFLQIYFGCGWIGAVTVPINVASRGPHLAHILINSQAKLLVVQAEFLDALNSLDIRTDPRCVQPG